MLLVERVETWGFEHAIRGMRNPYDSWDKSDSVNAWVQSASSDTPNKPIYRFVVGEQDLELMRKLYKGGSEHRKYLRQIFVSLDITAPLYWWKEFDTYKVGTVANSCSTMHTIHKKEFELEDFSIEHLSDENIEVAYINGFYSDSPKSSFINLINVMNSCRDEYLKTKDKKYWWQLIQLLPSSYNQKRTITMNYENIISMIKQRSGHKLDEWHTLIDEFKKLPYVVEIMEG